jgi:signal transduction histidine kinase
VLRRDGEQAQLAPQTGLGRLEALVGRAREGGLEVKVREQGQARPLTPGIDLTAYRIVQDALETAAEKGPRAPRCCIEVLTLTTFDLDEYVYDALRAGASGFLLKDVPADQLVAGIRLVAQGDALLAPPSPAG